MAITGAAGGGNWSAGGSWVGGIAPTAADDVILDATSGNITIDGTSGTPSLCRSLNCTGYTGTLAQGATAVLNIGDAGGGAATFVSGMVYVPTAGAVLNFVSTTGPNNVTWGGKSHKTVNFNGAGGSWVVQDAFSNNTNGNIALLQGTLDLNGKSYSVQTFTSNGTLTRTLTMGAATISTNSGSAGWAVTSTGLTLNAGTSNITIGSGSSLFTGGDLTYATVTLAAATAVSGANTYNNLVIGVGSRSSFSADQICTTLTMQGTAVSRSGITSSVLGTPRTFTVGTVTATGAAFRDITAAGAASWNLSAITASAEDLGGNTGITFTTPGTFYYQSAVTANYNDTTKWFNATNGGGGAGRIPLAQDTGVFDLNSVTAAGKTITMNKSDFGALTFTGVLNTPIFAFSTAATLNGNVTLDAGMTISGTAALTFAKRGAQSFTSAGVTVTNPLASNSISGTATFTDALTTSNTITETTGSITSSSTISCTTMTVTAGTFTLGGNVTLTGALAVATGATLTGAFAVAGGTTITGAGTINIGSFSGTTGTMSTGSAWTFTTLTLSGTFSNNTITSNSLTLGSGGMTCTAFSWGGTGGNGTFTSGSGLVSCSSTATWGGNGASTMNIGSGGFRATTITCSAGAAVPTFNLGSGTITLTGTGTVWTGAGTINKQTSTILISDTSISTKAFVGSTANYNNIRVNGAASNGTVTFSGAFTCSGTMTFDPDANIIFTKTTTYTIGTIAWTGTAGHVITIATNTAASAATISCANLVSCDYLSLKDNTATGNTPFYAGVNSTNVSGNTNWTFTAPPGITGSINSTGAADTMTATGALTFTGSMTATDAADTMTATGAVTVSSITGVLTATGAADSMAATGVVVNPKSANTTAASGRRHEQPMAKKRPHVEPQEEIDWHAIEEKRSADLKAMVEEMFIPKPVIVKTTEKPRKQESLAPHFASISEQEETHELEYLLLLAA